MKTENISLNIKELFIKKKAKFTKHDVSRARHLCREVIWFILDRGK